MLLLRYSIFSEGNPVSHRHIVPQALIPSASAPKDRHVTTERVDCILFKKAASRWHTRPQVLIPSPPAPKNRNVTTERVDIILFKNGVSRRHTRPQVLIPSLSAPKDHCITTDRVIFISRKILSLTGTPYLRRSYHQLAPPKVALLPRRNNKNTSKVSERRSHV